MVVSVVNVEFFDFFTTYIQVLRVIWSENEELSNILSQFLLWGLDWASDVGQPIKISFVTFVAGGTETTTFVKAPQKPCSLA